MYSFIDNNVKSVYDIDIINKSYELPVQSSEYGYYGQSGGFTAASGVLTVKVNVTPGYLYKLIGDVFGDMYVCEYTSDDIFIKSTKLTESSMLLRVSGITNYIKTTSRIKYSIKSPHVYLVSENTSHYETLNVGSEIINVVETGNGYYDTSLVFHENTNIKYKLIEVSGSRCLRAKGYYYGNMGICEFDSSRTPIKSHRIGSTDGPSFNSIDFITLPQCRYVAVATRISSGLPAQLFDFGSNPSPFPNVFYGIAGVQKNIYKDRFGVSDFGEVCIENASAPASLSITNFPNRVCFDAMESALTSLSIYPSINGKLIYGDDHYPNSSVQVKFKERTNPSTAKNILWIGDSISDYQNTAKYAKGIFDSLPGGIAPTFVGTQHTTGTHDESYAGRNTIWLLNDNSSPFVFNGVLDFAQYNQNLGIASVDCCVMAMGFNDASKISIYNNYTVDSFKNIYKTFVQKITEANPSIKIVWVLCPLGGKYSTNRNSIKHSEGVIALRNLVLELQYDYNNIIVSDAFYCIDSLNGYPLTSEPIASVYSSLGKTQDYCADSVHPTSLGCKEWGENVVGAIIEAFGL